MAKKKHDKRLEVALRMPSLRHKAERDGTFDIRESEAARWLCAQPEIMQWVFDKVRTSTSGLGFIVYDETTGRWRGREYEKR